MAIFSKEKKCKNDTASLREIEFFVTSKVQWEETALSLSPTSIVSDIRRKQRQFPDFHDSSTVDSTLFLPPFFPTEYPCHITRREMETEPISCVP